MFIWFMRCYLSLLDVVVVLEYCGGDVYITRRRRDTLRDPLGKDTRP